MTTKAFEYYLGLITFSLAGIMFSINFWQDRAWQDLFIVGFSSYWLARFVNGEVVKEND